MVTFQGKDKIPSLTVLDVGLVSKLSKRERKNIITLFTAVCEGDGYTAAEVLIDRDSKKHLPQNEEHFKREMAQFFDYLCQSDSEVIEFRESFGHVLDMGRKYQVGINSNLTSALIGSIIIEGLGRQLNPELLFLDEARPLLRHTTADLRTLYLKHRFKRYVADTKAINNPTISADKSDALKVALLE